MKRGQVYWADFEPVVGSEQGKTRPCVIVQNEKGNRYSPTTIVAAMTTAKKKTEMPIHVPISMRDEKMSKDTIILTEQLRTMDKRRLSRFICELSEETMEKVDKALEISLALNKERKEKTELNELQIFNNSVLGLKVRTILNDDGSISVNAEDTAIGFGWTQTQSKNGKQYTSIRWETLNGYCAEFGFPNKLGKDDYIPESLFYRLGMKACNARAEKFQNWLAIEVIPSIRKTGSYQQKRMTPEEMMRIQLGMIDNLDNRVTNLEDNMTALEETMTIDYGQQQVLGDAVNRTVIDVLGGKNSNAYSKIGKKVFAECNRDLKHFFNVNARNNVPKKQFDEAVEYAKNWKPCTNTMMMINDHNAQMTF